MPFKRTSKDTYKSPSGRKFTGAQVRLYYAHDGFPKSSTSPSKSKPRRKK